MDGLRNCWQGRASYFPGAPSRLLAVFLFPTRRSPMRDHIIIPKELICKYGARIANILTELFHRIPEQLPNSSIAKHASIREIISMGLAQKRTPEDIKSILTSLPKTNYCTWCKTKVLFLVEHHFPIPKIKGGKNTVYICPSCHHAFHVLEFQFPKLIKSIQLLFNEAIAEYDAYQKTKGKRI